MDRLVAQLNYVHHDSGGAVQNGDGKVGIVGLGFLGRGIAA